MVVVALAVGGVIALSGNSDEESGTAATAAGQSDGSATDLPTLAPAPPPEDGDDGPAPGVPGARAEAERARAKPVALGDAAAASDDVSVVVSKVERVRGKTVLPGEVGGPALRFTFTVTNEGDRPVTLSGSVANLYSGADASPESFLLEPGSSPFPSEIAPGRSVDGVFVFTASRQSGVPVLAEVDLDDDLRIVAFRGRPSDVL